MHTALSIIGFIFSIGTFAAFYFVLVPRYFRTRRFNYFLEDLVNDDIMSLVFHLELTEWFESFHKLASPKIRNQLFRALQRGFYRGSAVEFRPRIVGAALGNVAKINSKGRQRAIKLTILLTQRHQHYEFIIGLLERNKNIKTKVFLPVVRSINNQDSTELFSYMSRDHETARLLNLL